MIRRTGIAHPGSELGRDRQHRALPITKLRFVTDPLEPAQRSQSQKATGAAEQAHDHYACPVCIEKDKIVVTLQEEVGDYYLRCNGCRRIFLHTPEPEPVVEPYRSDF
jgi:hypothetical protein